MMHPIYGVLGSLSRGLGFEPVDLFADYPMFSVIVIVSWQWLPFALLILLTVVVMIALDRLYGLERLFVGETRT